MAPTHVYTYIVPPHPHPFKIHNTMSAGACAGWAQIVTSPSPYLPTTLTPMSAFTHTTPTVLPITNAIPPSTTLNTKMSSYNLPPLSTPTTTTANTTTTAATTPYHPTATFTITPCPTRHSVTLPLTLPLPLPPPLTTMRLPGLLPHTPTPHTLSNTLPPSTTPMLATYAMLLPLTQFGNCSGEPHPKGSLLRSGSYCGAALHRWYLMAPASAQLRVLPERKDGSHPAFV